MTVQDLIDRIRPKIGDKQENKWTNARLIEVINEGLEDLAKHANIHYSEKTYPILPYQRKLYIEDENFLELKRVRLNNTNIDFVTMDYMDSTISRWEEKTGDELEKIVYSNQNIRELTLYPLLTEASANYTALNETTQLLIDIPGVTQDEVYGLITSVDLSDIIVPSNIYDEAELQGYEPITHISDLFANIYIQYYSTPAEVSAVTDLITIDKSYINTLVYYVSGVVLLEDARTENKNTGALYLQKYNKDIKVDTGRNAESFQSVRTPEVPYRTGF